MAYTRVWTDPSMYSDQKLGTTAGRLAQSSGLFYYEKETFARIVLTTNATSIVLEALNDTVVLSTGFNSVGLLVNGAPQADGLQLSTLGAVARQEFTLPGGTNSLELIEGPASNTSYGGAPRGTPIRAFEIPPGFTYSIAYPTAPAKRIVVIGDSRGAGEDVTSGSTHASPTYQSTYGGLMRPNVLASSSGAWAGAHVLVDASGYRRAADFTATTPLITADVALRVLQCDGTSANLVIVDVQTNDFESGIAAATYQTNMQAWLSAIHAALPAVTVLLVQATTRANETVANGGGSTLPNFRSADVALATANSAFVTTVDGSSMVTYPTNFNADLLHPNTTGQAQLEAGIRTTLGY